MRIDHDTRRYWEGCSDRKLVIARCNHCAHWIHPPKGLCPECLSDDIGYQQVSGNASVYSFVRKAPAAADSAPTTIWAELAEQSRLIVVGDFRSDGPIAIGDALTLVWDESGSVPVPAFRKADAA